MRFLTFAIAAALAFASTSLAYFSSDDEGSVLYSRDAESDFDLQRRSDYVEGYLAGLEARSDMRLQARDKKVVCRICHGAHFTARCPYKG